MSAVTTETVGYDDAGIRLDRWFKKHHPGLPHSRLQKLLRKGDVRLDGKKAKTSDRIEAGQVIRIPPLEAAVARTDGRGGDTYRPSDDDARALEEMIIHRDADVIVLNKTPGLPVQGGSGIGRNLDAMLATLIGRDGKRPKLVHRLDKDTSGCLVLALNDPAARALTKAFRDRGTKKTYWALVMGVPDIRQGTIDLAIDKVPTRGAEKMAPSEDGKRAITDYAVIEAAAKKTSWLAMRPVTGRTHQLRVHAAAIGCPIVGDGKYGGAEAFLTGSISRKLHLHARSIALPHPKGGVLNVTANLPAHMAATWATLEFDADYSDDPFEDMQI